MGRMKLSARPLSLLLLLLSLLLPLLLVGACRSRPETSPPAPPHSPSFDYLILGATLYDGSGGPPRVADLGIKGERIEAIGDLARLGGKVEIPARGMILAPGFIDLHNHSDFPILRKGLRDNLCYLTQGCTTIVTGNCGSGQVDLASYFGRLAKKGAGTNVAHLIPHGSLRKRAMGGDFNRPPTDEELARMRKLAERAMREGAFGMSTGLIYTPGAFASTEEIIEIAKVVGAQGGIYASHIRGEGDHLLEAVAEALYIGKKAKLPVHISHFKASTPPNWGKVLHSCALVEEAQKNGRRVTVDQYPYRASSTSLGALVMPAWVREGSDADVKRRLQDPKIRAKVAALVRKNLKDRGGADQILIARFRGDPSLNGLSVQAAAEKTGMDPVDLAIDIQKRGGASAVAFSMSEKDVLYVMKKPYTATASDGSSKQRDNSRPHPRSYGTFARKIGRYSIRRGVLPLSQAIRSSTGLPADILGLKDRGYLRVGLQADLVLFDPKTFIDRATFVDPHQFSTGVLWVFVNGVPAIRDAEPTHALAGKPLRKGK
ncbi:MAG TPA: D-aminoacylase [Planctomycetes bacterium]|nr:D-aminoacylase [Planctomycetota bacterium]